VKTAYADTSFLVSLYTPDGHSPRAAGALRREIALVLTPFGEVELTNAIQLRVFREELNAAEAAAARRALQEDVASGVFSLKPLPASVFEAAKRLAQRHTPALGTRTLDILHVASALVLGADVLYTFDRGQRRLARAEALRVWPETA